MKVFDSCVWIAFCNEADSLHKDALPFFDGISVDEILLPFEVYAEVLTVLRIRSGENACQQFLLLLEYYDIEISFLAEQYFFEINQLFLQYLKLSMVDALLSALSRTGISVITFDKNLEKTFE